MYKNGTFTAGAVISDTCSAKYVVNFRSSYSTVTEKATDLIGKGICSGADPMLVYPGDISFVTNGNVVRRLF